MHIKEYNVGNNISTPHIVFNADAIIFIAHNVRNNDIVHNMRAQPSRCPYTNTNTCDETRNTRHSTGASFKVPPMTCKAYLDIGHNVAQDSI